MFVILKVKAINNMQVDSKMLVTFELSDRTVISKANQN